MNVIRTTLLWAFFAALLFAGCSTGDLSPLDPNAPNAKVAVKSDINFIRNITLSIQRIDGRDVQSFAGTLDAIIEPGARQIDVSVHVSSIGVTAPQTTTVYLQAQAGHTYIIVPMFVPGGVVLRVEDHFRGVVVTANG